MAFSSEIAVSWRLPRGRLCFLPALSMTGRPELTPSRACAPEKGSAWPSRRLARIERPKVQTIMSQSSLKTEPLTEHEDVSRRLCRSGAHLASPGGWLDTDKVAWCRGHPRSRTLHPAPTTRWFACRTGADTDHGFWDPMPQALSVVPVRRIVSSVVSAHGGQRYCRLHIRPGAPLLRHLKVDRQTRTLCEFAGSAHGTACAYVVSTFSLSFRLCLRFFLWAMRGVCAMRVLCKNELHPSSLVLGIRDEVLNFSFGDAIGFLFGAPLADQLAVQLQMERIGMLTVFVIDRP
jgi:hypothetical protein